GPGGDEQSLGDIAVGQAGGGEFRRRGVRWASARRASSGRAARVSARDDEFGAGPRRESCQQQRPRQLPCPMPPVERLERSGAVMITPADEASGVIARAGPDVPRRFGPLFACQLGGGGPGGSPGLLAGEGDAGWCPARAWRTTSASACG